MLRVTNITKSFQSKNVLRGIDFELAQSEILIVTGQNGSGKSTLLKILAGLISADSGRTSCNNIDTKNAIAWKEQMSFVSPESLLAENKLVESTMSFYKRFFNIPEQKFEACVADFKINELFGKKIENLSTGELRRVCLCLSFMRDTKLQLFDEPLVNLDTNFQEIFMKYLKHSIEGRYTILATHYPAAFAVLNPNFGLLKNGFLFMPGHEQKLDTDTILNIIKSELSA